jgi:hypothetical protein
LKLKSDLNALDVLKLTGIESTRVLPVAEPKAVAIWSSTKINNKTNDDQTRD